MPPHPAWSQFYAPFPQLALLIIIERRVTLGVEIEWNRRRHDQGLLFPTMPKGTIHKEHGLLVIQGPVLYLRTDEGGHWRLDSVPMKARKWIGRRVHVEGERDGFDLLAVRRIALC
jgi:hypothetical protein